MVFRVLDSDDKRPHPLFGDRRVRRAIAMSIDRPTMVQNILDTLGAPGIGPIVRSLGVVGSKDAQVGYDVDGAKQLLDSAGWRVAEGDSVRTKAGRRLAFTVLVQSANQPQMRSAAIIQEQLRKVGVQLTVTPLEFSVLAQHFMTKKFDALILGFTADASPSGIRQNWSVESARLPGGFNKSGYENPAFDATVDSAASTFDKAKSAELYRRAISILLADVPAIWIYEPRGTGAVHRRVVTAPYRADYWWAHLDEWSIDPEKMIDRDRIGLRVANR
jgi:peptide/nickel transport system substrate-binding protein